MKNGSGSLRPAPMLLLATFLLTGCTPHSTGAGTSAGAASPAVARTLRFGSGGGFTGSVTSYTLAADGHFTSRRGMPGDTTAAPTPLPTPSAYRVRAAFVAFDALPADSLAFNQPGNLTYFLEGRTRTGRAVRLTWGAPGARPAHAVRALYEELTTLIAPQ